MTRTTLQKKLNLKTKLVAPDKSFIYLLIAADTHEIKKGMEQFGQKIQMEIGASDLSSLQPCDSHFRPFYKLQSSATDININEQRIAQYLKKVKFKDERVTEKYSNHGLTKRDWLVYKSKIFPLTIWFQNICLRLEATISYGRKMSRVIKRKA
jgi:hypothetical protein